MHQFALSALLPAALGLVVTVGLSTWIGQRRDFVLDGGSVTLVTGIAVTVVMAATISLQRMSSAQMHARLREMEHRASHDELTGLLARDELRARLDVALRSAYRHDRVVGVLFLDLDGFKAINDSMGHEAGDELLRGFADRLRSSVRQEDLVARFGGDEFVVVTLGLERESAVREVAENVLRAFEIPIAIDDGNILMTPSVGTAIGSRLNPTGPDDLLANADQAMYRAKRLRLGVEGLVRWQHPVHGVLGPDRFLEVAEEAGLLARLGEVVMHEAVAQTSVWNHLYGPQHAVCVGVNLAERQLVDPAFADRVAEVLAWAGIGADQLALEIGEELLLRRIGDSSRVLHRVAELGCRIVIDDFGITHGALSRIRDLDLVRAVKIDRSVIAGLGKDNIARAVVEATVSMATALDIEVIAEGVETDEQQAMVVDLGIDLMQGFLFQQPLPAEEFERTGSLSVGR